MKAREDSNGNIITYSSVPKSWGAIICGFNTLSDSKLQTFGFYNVVVPSTNPSQKLGDIYFDTDNSVYTYPVVNRTYSQTVAELKAQKIANLKHLYNNKLAKTDWYVIRAAEGGTAIPSDIATERSDLRTECATKESEINAKTTKAGVVDYQLPNLD
tara:strand:+ start:3599 stop:4069 length:471 start_codon:yes stop_codon:yes gene_type:complete